jgi:putative heme-binding domain-containing protein
LKQGPASAAPAREEPVDLRGRDFSFDPRLLELRAESGGAQHGMSFDSRGRKFVCSNSDHIQLVMFEDRYATRNPYFPMPQARASIAADGPAAEVFRISPDEPWRVIRTRWRVAGLVPGPVEGGGRPSGYFTGATGTTIYRGDAFPADYRENAFVADCGSNLVHRKKLQPDGAGLIARRPDDEQQVEFLASRDNWFRPVQFANAPDGTLYIADMYREVIEHPWSLPASIKQHLDLNSGNDRGRIYRVVPDGFHQPKRPQLEPAATRDLVALLEHPNGWHRDTAARLLYERQDATAVPFLADLLKNSGSALARMHALYVLEGLGRLDEKTERKALRDGDGIVRQHAVRLAAQTFFLQSSFGRPWTELTRLADDPDILVRYQLAFALGEFHHRDAIRALGNIIRRDSADRWVSAAVLSSVKNGAADLFQDLARDAGVLKSASGREFLRQLAGVIGTKNDAEEVKGALVLVQKQSDTGIAFLLTRGLGDGLARAGVSLSRVDADGVLKPIFARAKEIVLDPAATGQTRVQAAQLLALTSVGEARETLMSLLGARPSEPLQLAATATLSRFADPGVDQALLKRWPELTARVRGELVTALLTRPERIGALLKAVEDRIVPAADFTVQQLQILRAHRDPKVRARAIELFGAPPEGKRDDVVKAFLPALQLHGDPARGKAIYLERCATCHRIGSQGHAVGPDLATVKTAGKETLLVNILDPNREVAPRYLNYFAETKAGESYNGLIVSESPASVTLRGPSEVETTLLRAQIAHLRASGQSLMPEGLELGLTPQDMANLLEYLGVAD